MKVPYSIDGSLTEHRIEHFQHIDEEAVSEAIDESGEEVWGEEAVLSDRYPYPRFWEVEEGQL
jgi:hypothetical protein